MIDTIANSRIRALYPSLWRNLTLLIKGFHSLIMLSFYASDITIIYSGITGHYGWFFYTAVFILTSEMIVMHYNSWRCPLTKLALAMGDETGDDLIADWFLSDKVIKMITPTLAALFVTGIAINVIRFVATVIF